ncbi:hypothetical protein ACHAXN_001177 [Cyclotella atomus]
MAINGCIQRKWSTIAVLSLLSSTCAFSPSPRSTHNQRIHSLTALEAHEPNTSASSSIANALKSLTATAAALTILSLPLNTPFTDATAHADEWGRETEAPTLFTGETVMICKKRGPLGACLETTVRTAQNDNDKSLEYFRDPSDEVKKRRQQSIQGSKQDDQANELIMKLRRQSEENRERNENEVRIKTLMNDQAASFGPFDRQVVILNTDGKTFTLLENPQAMRLKKAGYIGNERKFIIQPSQEVIDDALVGKNDLGEAIKGIFGGGSDEKVEGNVNAASVDSDNSETNEAKSDDDSERSEGSSDVTTIAIE